LARNNKRPQFLKVIEIHSSLLEQ